MKQRLLFSLFSLFVTFYSSACDFGTLSLTSQVANPDGSVTYTLDVYTDLGSLDAVYYGFTVSFNSPYNTPTVVIGGTYPTTASISSGDLSCGNLNGETLTALTGSDINSINMDSDWNPYMGMTNVISYEDGSTFGSASNDICFTIQVTVMGCVEEIVLNAHVNNGGQCILTESTGISCAPCSISALAAGSQSPCNASDDTYTQDVIVTYTNEPASGTLDVNGQSFAITSSPQTVTLTGLSADGLNVDVTALFSDDIGCTLSSTSLFTAPGPCSTPCAADNGTWD